MKRKPPNNKGKIYQAHKRSPKNTPLKILQTKSSLDYVLGEFNLTVDELTKIFSSSGKSKTISLWSEGKACASVKSINRIEHNLKLHGSSFIYELPLWRMLDEICDLESAEKGMQIYRTNRLPAFWNFPFNQNGDSDIPALNPLISDSQGLFERGDIFGFMGILYLLRKAEFENNEIAHLRLIEDAYRALPGLCRYKYFKRYWYSFYEKLVKLHHRMDFSTRLLIPKKSVIEKQIFSKEHIALRPLRDRFSEHGRFSEVESPISRVGINVDNLDESQWDYLSNLLFN